MRIVPSYEVIPFGWTSEEMLTVVETEAPIQSHRSRGGPT
jgi:hypothetical protein